MMSQRRTQRGQAVTELALSSLILVTLLTAGIYFGEVTFGALKVTEAGSSALWDMTHYKAHSMNNILYSTNPEVRFAAREAQRLTQDAYVDFDGRTSRNTTNTTLTQVMTNSTGMRVRCQTGGAPAYDPNILGILSYSDNRGARCNAEATFVTGPNMPRRFADNPQGFFQERNFTRPRMTACASGKANGGNCPGEFAIMLDDWGLTGPRGNEWNPCPGLPLGFGVPCPNNLSYWWTAFKGYLTSYTLNGAFKPVMFQMPASLMAQWVAFANPMGGFAGLLAFPMSGNESTFYMSFTGAVSFFQQPVWAPREGFLLWETTPYGVSLAVPYAIAHLARRSNNGCYLGKRCN